MDNHELAKQYPADAALLSQRRDQAWGEDQAGEVRSSLDLAITELGIDAPWEKLNPVQLKIARTLFASTLACFGPKTAPETFETMTRQSWSFAESEYRFTSNHSSLSVKRTLLDSDGNLMPGTTVLTQMPVFLENSSGPSLGSVSPIRLVEDNGSFELHLSTPSGNIWKQKLELRPVDEIFNSSIDNDGQPVPLSSIVLPCSSQVNRVTVIRPTCQENCLMCSVTKGDGAITDEYQEQLSQALDLLIDEAAGEGRPFGTTLSGGSLSDGDGGFKTSHAMVLDLIKQKISQKESQLDHKIPVQLQLEMMLPPDKDAWIPVIQEIYGYVQGFGWDISLAINIEVLPDEWEGIFLRGEAKGASTLEDHLEFAWLLSQETDGRIIMNSLVMFGLKPAAVDYGTYMTQDLSLLQKLIEAGIHPEYAPVRIETGTPLEAFPPPDPVYFMLQYVALREKIIQAQQTSSSGCVGCNLCHQLPETIALLNTAKKEGISLSELFVPLLSKLGPEYSQAFREIFP